MRIFQPTITGSIDMTGSFTVTGSITSNLLTVVSGSSTELSVTGTGVTIGNVITDTHRITGSLSISGSATATTFIGNLTGTATTASFIPTTDLATLPTALSFTAPVASITSGGSASETTIQTLTIPGGVYKSGDNILLTIWGLRTTGAATGVNSTLTTRITNISGTTIFASTTGNRNHNFTLTARVLSDTSILWYGGAVAAAAIATTVTSVSGSGFTLNFSVTRDLNTSEFTLYNAICRKYN